MWSFKQIRQMMRTILFIVYDIIFHIERKKYYFILFYFIHNHCPLPRTVRESTAFLLESVQVNKTDNRVSDPDPDIGMQNYLQKYKIVRKKIMFLYSLLGPGISWKTLYFVLRIIISHLIFSIINVLDFCMWWKPWIWIWIRKGFTKKPGSGSKFSEPGCETLTFNKFFILCSIQSWHGIFDLLKYWSFKGRFYLKHFLASKHGALLKFPIFTNFWVVIRFICVSQRKNHQCIFFNKGKIWVFLPLY